MKQLIVLFLVLFLSACSFNSIFLHPTVLTKATPNQKMVSGTDTTIVHFSGENHQPIFTNNLGDTLDLGFTIESVMYTNSNGNKLNGWMLKPKKITPQITLLHFHGNAGCLLSQYRAMSPLLDKGFQIFIFDYSGFGFSEGKATRRNVLIDANSTLSYLKERTDVKSTKLVIYGQSLGGHLSAVVAANRQAEIDALVIEAAFSSHKDIGAHFVPFFGRIFIKDGYSAKKSIHNYHKPLLVIHSTEDELIPFKLGKKIYAAANPPKDFFEIKHCHICGPTYYPDEIAAKIKLMVGVK